MTYTLYNYLFKIHKPAQFLSALEGTSALNRELMKMALPVSLWNYRKGDKQKWFFLSAWGV